MPVGDDVMMKMILEKMKKKMMMASISTNGSCSSVCRGCKRPQENARGPCTRLPIMVAVTRANITGLPTPAHRYAHLQF